MDAAAAAKEYSKRKVPAAPCGRYGATVVVYQQQMWLFGGTDGGFSKKGHDKSKAGTGAGSAIPLATCSRQNHICWDLSSLQSFPAMITVASNSIAAVL